MLLPPISFICFLLFNVLIMMFKCFFQDLGVLKEIHTYTHSNRTYIFICLKILMWLLAFSIHNNLIDLKITCVYDFENSEGAEYLKKITLKSRKLSVENVTPESKKILL